MGQNLKLHRLTSGVVQDISLVARATSTGVKSATQNVEFMQADTINLTVVSATAIDFQIGDYLEVCGDVYILNQLPTIKKTGKRLLEYTLVLEGISYQLIDTTFFMPFSVSIDALTGTVRDFLDVVITNLNRTHPNKWAVGSCISGGETKTITYQDQNCLQVLQDICNQFNVEFSITRVSGTADCYNINIAAQIGNNTGMTFRYGAQRVSLSTGWLYNITRTAQDNGEFATKLYVYGGTQNLPASYCNDKQSSRLCLPSAATKTDSFLTDAAAVALYGVKERVKIYDEIHPEYIGSATTVYTSNILKFKDSHFDFDLNATDEDGNTLYLIPGTSAKITFQSGDLAGYEFEVAENGFSWSQSSGATFILVQKEDSNGMQFPNEDLKISRNDKYIITDIVLPQSYITAAANKLNTKGAEDFALCKTPGAEYSIEVASPWIKKCRDAGLITSDKIFTPGDIVTVIDEDLGIGGTGKQLRITGFTRNLLEMDEYTLNVAVYVKKTVRNSRIIRDVEIWRRLGRTRLSIERFGLDQAVAAFRDRTTAIATRQNIDSRWPRDEVRIDNGSVIIGNASITPLTGSDTYIQNGVVRIGGVSLTPLTGSDTYIQNGVIHIGGVQVTPLTGSDVYIQNGVIHVGQASITPLTSSDAYIQNGVVHIGGVSVTPLTSSDVSIKDGVVKVGRDTLTVRLSQDGKLTVDGKTIAPLGVDDVSINTSTGAITIKGTSINVYSKTESDQRFYIDTVNGIIHLGNNTITPLTGSDAYILNGVIHIGTESITPVADDGNYLKKNDAAYQQLESRVATLVSNMNVLAAELSGYHLSRCDDKQCGQTQTIVLQPINTTPVIQQ